MGSLVGRCLETLRSLSGNIFGTIFCGPSVTSGCGWWFKIGVLLGITCERVVCKAPRCVCCAVIVRRLFLISFSNVLSLGRFGTFGGVCRTRPIGMSFLWLSSLIVGARPVLQPLFFKLLGLKWSLFYYLAYLVGEES